MNHNNNNNNNNRYPGMSTNQLSENQHAAYLVQAMEPGAKDEHGRWKLSVLNHLPPLVQEKAMVRADRCDAEVYIAREEPRRFKAIVQRNLVTALTAVNARNATRADMDAAMAALGAAVATEWPAAQAVIGLRAAEIRDGQHRANDNLLQGLGRSG